MSGPPRSRVLVVDDSAVVRRLIADALAGDDDVEVVATAANGRLALERIRQHEPDLVTLDVEMPDMDGLAALRRIRAEWPRLPVVMFSTLTERGAQVTVEALLLGADDYVTKPSDAGGVDESVRRIRETLVPCIHALCARGRSDAAAAPRAGGEPRASDPGPSTPPARGPAPSRHPGPARRHRATEVIVVGVSTGGPAALATLLPALPVDLPAPVLIVQHMPATFTRMLAHRLDNDSGLAVREAADGDVPLPGEVLIAPGGRHLEVRSGANGPVLRLTDGPPENSCRPAADVLFRTAAAVYGEQVLAVVLTGMGSDGRKGSQAIQAAGGQVVVQDEASSVVWGMPGAVVAAGACDRILPLREIAGSLTRAARAGRHRSTATAGEVAP